MRHKTEGVTSYIIHDRFDDNILVLIIYNVFAEAKASYVTVIRESAVVFGALLGFIFLREKATPNKIAGILAIVMGIILIRMD